MSELITRCPSGTENVAGCGLWPNACMFWVDGSVSCSAEAEPTVVTTKPRAIATTTSGSRKRLIPFSSHLGHRAR